MDRLAWENHSKATGPLPRASVSRQPLDVAREPCYWFSLYPLRCKANNRRLLVPHSDRQARLIAAGGETRQTSYGDGTYRLRPGSLAARHCPSISRELLWDGFNGVGKAQGLLSTQSCPSARAANGQKRPPRGKWLASLRAAVTGQKEAMDTLLATS